MKKGSWAWVVVGVALIAPAFMAFNWWKTMNARPKFPAMGATTAVSGVIPGNSMPKMQSNGLGSPSVAGGLPAPSFVQNARSYIPRPVSTTTLPKPAAVLPAPSVSNTPKAAPSPAPANIKLTPAAPAPVNAVSNASPQVQVSTNSIKSTEVGYNPATDRDPMLSPREMQSVRAQAAQRLRPVKSVPDARQAKVRQRAQLLPVDRRISVMGIIITPESTRAIVNDHIVQVGDEVLGARIVKITKTAVTFKLKGKQFMKAVPRE